MCLTIPNLPMYKSVFCILKELLFKKRVVFYMGFIKEEIFEVHILQISSGLMISELRVMWLGVREGSIIIFVTYSRYAFSVIKL